MKFINKQAFLLTLTADSAEVYTPKTDVQIRAFTVHNPTTENIDLIININSLQMAKKTVTAGSTEVVSSLFNQQVKKDEVITVTGTGINIMLTVVEITE